MNQRVYLCLVVISSLFVIFYFNSFEDSTPPPSPQLEHHFSTLDVKEKEEEESVQDQINSTFPITFYHKAYVDYRYTPPRLRIFSLNACISKANFLLVDIYHQAIVTPTRIKMFGDSLEGNCPSTYGPAKPCLYVAHTFFANLTAPGGISKVQIHLGTHRKVTLQATRIDKRLEPGLTMCIQPVYYYSQWQNIVLYVEAWRAQGASRFIVFYHSATRETRKVFEYYQSLGIIELRAWPSFGNINLPANIAQKWPKIDESVFIFSYFLAMNLCILDIKTTIGTIADFDEVMVARNGTVLDYALKEMTDTNVGALRFGNNYVAMEPSIYSGDFSGTSNPIFIDKGGPPKNIFNASVIDIAQVHWVRSFTEEKVTKNTRQIFNGTVPVFSPELIDGLNSCVKRISKKKNTCRSTGGMCKEEMDRLGEWVYDRTEGVFLS
uniref:Glycosyltransferase family 92 protein n=1 Tax=Caenorhabditis japonica TaxID=281687 RepID=A0A8R1DZZ1_CAEJA